MEIVPASQYPPSDWATPARPRQPYRFWEIELVEDEADDAELPELRSYRSFTQDALYLKGPIHTHLLNLEAGNTASLIDFALSFGLEELTLWGLSRQPNKAAMRAWQTFNARYLPNRKRRLPAPVPAPAFAALWTHRMVEAQFIWDQTALRKAMDLAHTETNPARAVALLMKGENVRRRTEIELHWEEISLADGTEADLLIETPSDIFSRAWLELLDGLAAKRLPRHCAYCASPFIPNRSDQRFCPGRDCQQQSFDRRYARDPWRREYQKMYQRKRRGTITQEDFDHWKHTHPRPEQEGTDGKH